MARSSQRLRCISISIILVSAAACSRMLPEGESSSRGAGATAEPSATPSSRLTTRLRLSGAFEAKTSSSLAGSGFGCGMHDETFFFETNAMRVGSGAEVARVDLAITGFTGPSTYGAVEPSQPYRRTPVQVITASNAATGGGIDFFVADRGRITVLTGGPISVHETTGFVRGRISSHKAVPAPCPFLGLGPARIPDPITRAERTRGARLVRLAFS